jgi:hypothetical protein
MQGASKPVGIRDHHTWDCAARTTHAPYNSHDPTSVDRWRCGLHARAARITAGVESTSQLVRSDRTEDAMVLLTDSQRRRLAPVNSLRRKCRSRHPRCRPLPSRACTCPRAARSRSSLAGAWPRHERAPCPRRSRTPRYRRRRLCWRRRHAYHAIAAEGAGHMCELMHAMRGEAAPHGPEPSVATWRVVRDANLSRLSVSSGKTSARPLSVSVPARLPGSRCGR